MLSLAQRYRPVLSTPFGREGYYETAPCDALKPYIRCFWTEKQNSRKILVIPDTCMDIIFMLGENGGEVRFCTLDESSFYSASGGKELFGVRFYAWTAQLFSRRDFSCNCGKAFHMEEYFTETAEFAVMICNAKTFEERVEAAEIWLMKQTDKIHENNDLLNSVDFIIESRGAVKISELCIHTAVSARQLERVFMKAMGVSPKTFSSLVRYQLLWREMAASPEFNISDAVYKYGYSDQPHLLNDFRRRHLMTPKQALDYAAAFSVHS